LENFDNDDDSIDINRVWESIRENMKASDRESLGYYYELTQHKLWLYEECSKLLDQRKRAKLHWLENTSQKDGDNVNTVRRETSRTLGKEGRNMRRKEIVRTNISALHRCINELKRCFQCRTNVVRDEILIYLHVPIIL
jgi:hypothetical protein